MTKSPFPVSAKNAILIPEPGTELRREEYASTMMVNTSIDSGSAPVSYVSEEYLVAKDRAEGTCPVVYRDGRMPTGSRTFLPFYILITTNKKIFFWPPNSLRGQI